MEFTPEEKNFLKLMISQVTVKPTAEDAVSSIQLIQGIIKKLG